MWSLIAFSRTVSEEVTLKFLCLILSVVWILSASAALANIETQFVLEYANPGSQPGAQIATQTITLRESEKEKKFTRLADQAQCSMIIGEVTPLVSSYRKIEMLLECQAQYTKVSSGFSCLSSDPQASAAQLTERKGKSKQVQVHLSGSHRGFHVANPQKHHFKSRVTKLTPAWDSTGCQSLGETLDHLGTENLRSKVRCCYLK